MRSPLSDKKMQPRHWRLIAWSGGAAIVLFPLLAMQISDDVNWGLGDFAFACALVIGVGLAFELAVRTSRDRAYRMAAGLALASAFILTWANLAVGIIGSEDNLANRMYFGVILVGITGALLARFKPSALALAMYATAFAQVLVAAIALIEGLGFTGPITVFFTALWLTSGWLFGKSAREQSS